MPRKQYLYHFIYKTTNLINDKFYVGMHSTFNLDDRYMGSGTQLCYSINKYGRENFKCEILEFLPDRESLRKREHEIVNIELLDNHLSMNICLGGSGARYGTIFPDRKSSPLSESHKANISKSCAGIPKPMSEAHKAKIKTINIGRVHTEESCNKRSIANKNAWIKRKENGLIPIKRSLHSEETKEKIRESNKKSSRDRSGANNPRAKTYIFTDPSGNEFIVNGTRRLFCKEHCLSLKKIVSLLKLSNNCVYNDWTIIQKIA